MKNRGQNIMEYALIIGIVSLALAGLNTLFKRQVQGVVKASADEMGRNASEDFFCMTGKNVSAQILGSATSGLREYKAQMPYTVWIIRLMWW
jgi:Flp pilus assembly pilin Flp